MPGQYSWFRDNGDIPSSASGQNTNTLTLHDVVLADEGEYYCIVSQFGHCARSNNVMVSVRGKRNNCMQLNFQCVARGSLQKIFHTDALNSNTLGIK